MHKCFSFIDSFYKKFYTKFYIYQINKKWQNRHHNYILGIYLPKSLTLNLDPLHNFNTLMKWSHDDMTMKLSNTLWSCCIININVYKHTYTHNMTMIQIWWNMNSLTLLQKPHIQYVINISQCWYQYLFCSWVFYCKPTFIQVRENFCEIRESLFVANIYFRELEFAVSKQECG